MPKKIKYKHQKELAKKAGKLPPGVVPIAEQMAQTPFGGDVVNIGGKKVGFTPELLALKERYDTMTTLQSNWFNAYIINRDGSRSAELAGYTGSKSTLARQGTNLKHKFQDMIDIMDSYTQEIANVVTELTGIYQFWGELILDNKHLLKDRLKASELLARALGAFDGENGDTNINFYSEKFDQVPQETLEAFIISETITTEKEKSTVERKPPPRG